MNKRIISIIMVGFLLIALGCGDKDKGTTADGGGTTSRGGSTDSFIGGDVGLDVKFMEGAPPSEVYDLEYSFGINVRLENQGEYDVPKDSVTLKITGIDPSDFGKNGSALTKTNSEELLGAKIDPQGNEIAGGIANIDFEGLQAKPVTGNVQFNIRSEVCYPYGTTAIAQACILEDLLGTTRKAGEEPFCEVTGEKTVENSGAPVQITSFSQSATGKDKVSFTFEVGHVGEGLLFKNASNCEAGLANKDKVYVKVVSDMPDLSCSGLSGSNEGEVSLYGEEGGEKRSVVCTQKLAADRTDSEKQVKITLQYAYKEKVDTELLVKHVEE